jgi:eukaryotic-like serine/threonine-protein kinase
MLVGQRLGPFAIDRELGSGAMGTVYAGVYTKTGQRVAVKVMAPGLGTRETAAARFEREAAILKQFNHPNIVRLFGTGRYHGTPYYAMEFIEGESLDHVLARRGRLTWEEVVTLGQQLCSALQHAHLQGVIHRDLKPSNLMILPDGTLKLTDFGIAKDLDVTQLTSANCTVGTASYMSPEQCQGSRNLTYKSDLYSLGVVFYELLTGRKPFEAENAMDMFLMHVQGKFERPSRRVLDVPVWLDTLVCQLLEKKPEHRPLDAAMVANVLGSIQEKVQAQQSAGVDRALSRRVDRPRGERALDETDREAARTLRGLKSRRKERKPRFYQTVWFQIAGMLAVLGGLALVLYLIFRPPSADKLYYAAERVMESKNPDNWFKANDLRRDGPIALYLKHYGNRDDEKTRKVRAWSDLIDVRLYDDQLQVLLKNKRRGLTIEPEEGGEKESFAALEKEEDGDLAEARKRWGEISQKSGPDSGQPRWGMLAKERLRRLDEEKAKENDLERHLGNLRRSGLEPAVQGPDQKALMALRYRRFGDLPRAAQRFEELKKDLASDPDQRPLYLLAASMARESKGSIQPPKKSPDEDRVELIVQRLQEAADMVQANRSFLEAREICLDVIALYDGAPGLEKLVANARQLLKNIPIN